MQGFGIALFLQHSGVPLAAIQFMERSLSCFWKFTNCTAIAKYIYIYCYAL